MNCKSGLKGWFPLCRTFSTAVLQILALGGDCALAQLQLIPDNTLGGESSVVTPNVDINSITSVSISGGAIRGANLFHSFQEFNINEGRGAYFTNPAGIENILSRVTGGNASNILGKLGVLGNANLFLINPSGIIFGLNASLDLRGSFVGTTASAIGLSNKDIFSANPGEPVPTKLLNVNPNAFFFNQIAAQPITVNSRKYIGNRFDSPDPFNAFNSYQGLKVPDSKSLLLLGGNVSLDGGILQAPGGRVDLGGVASPGTVGLVVDSSNLSLSFPDNVQRADVSLTNMAAVDVIAGGGGTIAVNARNLDIFGASKLIAGIGEGNGSVGSQAGDIRLNATGAITLGQSDWISSSTIENNISSNAIGNGGNINIKAESLSMTDNSVLSTNTAGQGNAGSIFVQVEGMVDLIDNSYIDSSASLIATGNGGNIQIEAGSLLMDRARLSAGSTRSSQTIGIPFGQGNGGSISVQVEGAVDLIHSSIDSFVGSRVVGNGGNIQIKAESLSMTDEAIVSTTTYGQGNAGNISVQVEDKVSLTTSYINSFVNFVGEEYRAVGKGGDIQIKAGSLIMTADPSLRIISGANISASTLGTGNAGNIFMQVKDKVSLSDNSYISSSVNNTAVGNGSNIHIEAGSLSMTDGTRLSTSTNGQGNAGNIFVQVENEVSLKNNSIDSNVGNFKAVGDGGDIQIKARSLQMTDAAKLSSSTLGQGNAGNIEINATELVSISGFDRDQLLRFSGLFTTTEKTAIGQGGNISVTTDTLRVSDRARLNARTNNTFRGGNITVDANKVEVTSGGKLLTTAFSSGEAGNITVNSTDSITISGSDRTYLVQPFQFREEVVDGVDPASGLFANTFEDSTGQGGNLRITTGQLNVRDGAQVSVSSEGSGNAGSLTVNANSIKLDNQGKLQASTASGEGGNVDLQVQDLILMRRQSQISAEARNNGNGGNITINSPDGFVVAAPSENSDIIANAFQGRGGNINITTSGIYGLVKYRPELPPEISDINASSQFGVNGTVEINTPDVDPNRGLVNLPTAPLDTEVSQVCQPRTAQNQSSFTITGRGGLPPNPRTEPLSSDAVQVDWVTLKPRTENRASTSVLDRTSPTLATIVEAQGWERNAKGQVVLTANAPTIPHSSWQTPIKCHGS